jgi:four helix bundle protein
MDLAVRVYELTRGFPKHELYGLASLMQRAAVSIPANIAHGNIRHHTGDYLRHLSIARASLAELETHLELAQRFAYSSPDDVASCVALCSDVGRQLNALRGFLEHSRTESRLSDPHNE